MPNKWAGPNKWVGWADFLVYYMKNSGEGGQILRLLYEKQRAGWTNFQKSLINGHARLLGTQEQSRCILSKRAISLLKQHCKLPLGKLHF